MSEKRFEITEYGSNYYIEIIDNEKELDESIDNPSQRLGLVECADLLNELSEENEQLRLELETHKHPLWSTREAEKKVNKLNEEINQLRIENMRLKKKGGDEMSENQFVVETVEITDCDTDVSRIAKVITDTKETYSYEDLDEIVHKLNEQQATIKQLESDKAIAEDYANIFEKENVKLRIENKKLKEENEQLRQIMNDIVVATDETYAKNASVFKVTVVLDFEKYMEIRRCIE